MLQGARRGIIPLGLVLALGLDCLLHCDCRAAAHEGIICLVGDHNQGGKHVGPVCSHCRFPQQGWHMARRVPGFPGSQPSVPLKSEEFNLGHWARKEDALNTGTCGCVSHPGFSIRMAEVMSCAHAVAHLLSKSWELWCLQGLGEAEIFQTGFRCCLLVKLLDILYIWCTAFRMS